MLTARRLREVLDYNASTGVFRWKVSSAWSIRVGDIAGSLYNGSYRVIRVDGRRYSANRLAWLYVRGHWPGGEIDHKNAVSTDDRFDNLRDTTHAENMQNQRRAQSHNKTGMLGVSASGSKFWARITVNGKQHYLGIFPTADDAHAAYLAAKRAMHPAGTL